MYLTKTRLIVGDLFALVTVGLVIWANLNSPKNVLAMTLVMALLLARSAFFHVRWYKTTRRFY
jgi:hypothetical protein